MSVMQKLFCYVVTLDWYENMNKTCSNCNEQTQFIICKMNSEIFSWLPLILVIAQEWRLIIYGDVYSEIIVKIQLR